MKNCSNRYIRILMAALVAILILFVDYWAMNRSVSLSSEKIKLQIFEYIKQGLFGVPTSHASDSVLMIDVHYDKTMVSEYMMSLGGRPVEMGQVPVTDREKLLRLLDLLKQNGYDYRYVMLDVRFEASTQQDQDSALWNAIGTMKRVVIARPDSSERLASSLLEAKAGGTQYRTTIWETDFVKYPFYLDTVPSMALKMYRELFKKDIRPVGPLWMDGYRLARKCAIQTWDYTDSRRKFYLGDFVNDLASVEPDYQWDGNPTGKYILIGDFEDDVHSTFYGEIPGTVLIYNAYLSLVQERHLLSPLLLVSLFSLFFILAWFTITRNRYFAWLCSFWGYAGFLTLFCIFTYITSNVVYDILVTSLLFCALKKCVEWYDRRHEIKAFLKHIVKR